MGEPTRIGELIHTAHVHTWRAIDDLHVRGELTRVHSEHGWFVDPAIPTTAIPAVGVHVLADVPHYAAAVRRFIATVDRSQALVPSDLTAGLRDLTHPGSHDTASWDDVIPRWDVDAVAGHSPLHSAARAWGAAADVIAAHDSALSRATTADLTALLWPALRDVRHLAAAAEQLCLTAPERSVGSWSLKDLGEALARLSDIGDALDADLQNPPGPTHLARQSIAFEPESELLLEVRAWAQLNRSVLNQPHVTLVDLQAALFMGHKLATITETLSCREAPLGWPASAWAAVRTAGDLRPLWEQAIAGVPRQYRALIDRPSDLAKATPGLIDKLETATADQPEYARLALLRTGITVQASIGREINSALRWISRVGSLATTPHRLRFEQTALRDPANYLQARQRGLLVPVGVDAFHDLTRPLKNIRETTGAIRAEITTLPPYRRSEPGLQQWEAWARHQARVIAASQPQPAIMDALTNFWTAQYRTGLRPHDAPGTPAPPSPNTEPPRPPIIFR